MSFSIQAHRRNLPMSPRKVRLVVDLVRGKEVDEALALLKYTPNSAAAPTFKLLSSAAANAEETYGLPSDELYISEISVGPGRTRRKGRFGARGRFKPERSRSCHISLALREINEASPATDGELSDNEDASQSDED